MAEETLTEPKVVSVNVNFHGSIKVAMESYGKRTGESGCSVSRQYLIPPDWTEDQVREFELEKIIDIQTNIDPFLQDEHDNMMDARPSNFE